MCWEEKKRKYILKKKRAKSQTQASLASNTTHIWHSRSLPLQLDCVTLAAAAAIIIVVVVVALLGVAGGAAIVAVNYSSTTNSSTTNSRTILVPLRYFLFN